MKKIFSVVLVAFVLLSCAFPAYADDNEDVVTVPVGDLTDPYIVSSSEELPGDVQLYDVVLTSVAPVQSSDTTGLKSVLLGLLGDYDPIIAEYKYISGNNSYYSYLREVQPDYVWLCSFGMLALFIYCLFRLGGVLLNG